MLMLLKSNKDYSLKQILLVSVVIFLGVSLSAILRPVRVSAAGSVGGGGTGTSSSSSGSGYRTRNGWSWMRYGLNSGGPSGGFRDGSSWASKRNTCQNVGATEIILYGVSNRSYGTGNIKGYAFDQGYSEFSGRIPDGRWVDGNRAFTITTQKAEAAFNNMSKPPYNVSTNGYNFRATSNPGLVGWFCYNPDADNIKTRNTMGDAQMTCEKGFKGWAFYFDEISPVGLVYSILVKPHSNRNFEQSDILVSGDVNKPIPQPEFSQKASDFASIGFVNPLVGIDFSLPGRFKDSQTYDWVIVAAPKDGRDKLPFAIGPAVSSPGTFKCDHQVEYSLNLNDPSFEFAADGYKKVNFKVTNVGNGESIKSDNKGVLITTSVWLGSFSTSSPNTKTVDHDNQVIAGNNGVWNFSTLTPRAVEPGEDVCALITVTPIAGITRGQVTNPGTLRSQHGALVGSCGTDKPECNPDNDINNECPQPCDPDTDPVCCEDESGVPCEPCDISNPENDCPPPLTDPDCEDINGVGSPLCDSTNTCDPNNDPGGLCPPIPECNPYLETCCPVTGNGFNCQHYSVKGEPYFRVYGSDVVVGKQFMNNGVCSPKTGSSVIDSFALQTGAGFIGAGSQFAVTSTSQMRGLLSANMHGGITSTADSNGKVTVPNIDLMFTNNVITKLGYDTTAYTGCMPDYKQMISSDAGGSFTPLGTSVTHLTQSMVDSSSSKRFYKNGDLIINENLTTSTPPSYDSLDDFKPLIVIVKGNIKIAPNVTSLDGLYVAMPDVGNTKGAITTCARASQINALPSLAKCQAPLTVNGSFVAKKVYLNRLRGSISQASPNEPASSNNIAEKFIFTPDMYFGLMRNLTPNLSNTSNSPYDSIVSLPPVL